MKRPNLPPSDQQSRVSVVMPAYNVAAYIGAALASVAAQTWPRIEMIVVDDGSTDGTGDEVEGQRGAWSTPNRTLTLIRQDNRGAAAARNTGMAQATGDYIALYDADDLCHPTLMSRQVATLEADPALDLAFALYHYIDADGTRLATQTAPASDRLGTYDILCDNVVHSPLFRAEAARAVGPLDESLRAHIDLDFFTRITQRRAKSIGVVPEALSDYRRRPDQITGDWRRMRENWQRVHAKLVADGMELTEMQERRMLARLRLYWATLAYQTDDLANARRLAFEALRHDPGGVLADPHGRVRLLACAASLLPRAAHDRLRDWYNARGAA
ncbi:MAG: glycosyltransferase family A protein [Pseudomonadota bacterium]